MGRDRLRAFDYFYSYMKWLFATLFLLISAPSFVGAQQLSEKLLGADAGDSLLLKAFRTAADSSGNYYFETMLPGKGERFAMMTNKEKHVPVYWSRNIGLAEYKTMISDAFFSDSTHKRLFYKNKSGTRIYGPHEGRVRNILESGKDNVAIELCVGSRSYLYINDKLVNETDSLHQLWLCSFSDNGHVLYTVYKNGAFRLYLDHKQIDSAEEMFSEIAVNNNGFYTYARPLGGKFYIRTANGSFGPFGSVDYSDLWNNGAYYYRGCADSQCYVLVNGKLYDHIPEAHSYIADVSGNMVYQSEEQISVVPYDKDNYLFTYNKQGESSLFLNINGKVTQQHYSSTGFIFSDREGGYAFYGYRDTLGVERVYKNINGKEARLPSFHRARYKPHVLQVDPSGGCVFYYETADSIYLFRNDTLLCPPAQKKRFATWDASVLPQSHPEGFEYFQGININGVSYLVYNNTVSRPLSIVNTKYDVYDEPAPGAIVGGDINASGFYIIENTAPGKYMLVINNAVYKELQGIDHIISGQGYHDEHRVIFYGTKGNGLYQFTVTY